MPGKVDQRASALILGLWNASCICFVQNLAAASFRKDGKMNISWKEYFQHFDLQYPVLLVSNLSFLTINTPFSGTYSFEIGNIRTIVDLVELQFCMRI